MHPLMRVFSYNTQIGNVDIFVKLKFENKSHGETTQFNCNSTHHDNYKFALKLI